MTKHVDVAIIGAGPAGLAAARVVGEAGLSCLVIDKMGPGGELMNMGEIHGLAGIDPGTTGPDFLGKLVDDAMNLGAELAVDEVTGLALGRPWTIRTLEGKRTASAVILATGLARGTTGLAEEEAFEGHGLSHCGVCDGPLYAGRSVVVFGDHDWSLQEALDLAATCSKVTLVTSGQFMIAAERQVQIAALSNLRVVRGRIAKLTGLQGLDLVLVETGSGTERVPASGLFIQAGRRPATVFAAHLPILEASGHVAVDAAGLTAIASLFACGDVRIGALRSIAEAIADGERAGHNAVGWIESLKAAG